MRIEISQFSNKTEKQNTKMVIQNVIQNNLFAEENW